MHLFNGNLHGSDGYSIDFGDGDSIGCHGGQGIDLGEYLADFRTGSHRQDASGRNVDHRYDRSIDDIPLRIEINTRCTSLNAPQNKIATSLNPKIRVVCDQRLNRHILLGCNINGS